MGKGMTYKQSGVNYDTLDPFKRAAQMAARSTAKNLDHWGGLFKEIPESRGESAYLLEIRKAAILAHVEEGLGTKNLVADALYRLQIAEALRKLTLRSYYDHVAQCTVAMIVNDLITLGALPVSIAMHVASGDSRWFEDEMRNADLIGGWKKACDLSYASWGGGETPTLREVVLPETVVLSGSALGAIYPRSRRLLAKDIRHGDAILMLESSGIHANGLTLARSIAKKLKRGYMTELSDGRTYGETLLDPTHIYVRFLKDCFEAGIKIHYAVNITGHGWRKLMRAGEPFTYVIDRLPSKRPIFDFIQEQGRVDDAEAYGNLNMNAGFALYLPTSQAQKALELARKKRYPYRAFISGHIESGEKKVVIRPKGLEFGSHSLAVR